MVKKIIFILYILVLVCMAAATIVEKSQGTDYAHAHYYGHGGSFLSGQYLLPSVLSTSSKEK